MAMTKEDFISAIKEMSVMELNVGYVAGDSIVKVVRSGPQADADAKVVRPSPIVVISAAVFALNIFFIY